MHVECWLLEKNMLKTLKEIKLCSLCWIKKENDIYVAENLKMVKSILHFMDG